MEQEIHPSVFGAEALMETYSDNIILFGPDALAQLGEELFLSDRKTILLVMGGASARIPLRMILGSPVFRKPGLNMPRCLLYTSPSPRDLIVSRMPSSA